MNDTNPPQPRLDIMRLIAVAIVAGLTWRVLELTASRPALMKEQFWVVLCTALAVTAFGTMVNYFLGSSKGSSDRAAQAMDQVSNAPPPGTTVGPVTGDVTVTPQAASPKPIAKFPL